VISRRTLATRGGTSSESEASERSVDVEIARLRRKIDGAAHCLQTVRGQGYRLIADTAKSGATEHRHCDEHGASGHIHRAAKDVARLRGLVA